MSAEETKTETAAAPVVDASKPEQAGEKRKAEDAEAPEAEKK